MADDPYRYFRIEARELLEAMGASAMALERAPDDKSHVAQMLRCAHTLKGAARVVRQPAIAEQAHAIEDVLAPFREGGAVARMSIDALLQSIDAIAAGLKTLDPAAEKPRAPADAAPVAAPEEPLETVRVELSEVDALLEGVAEVGVHLTALRASLGAVEGLRQRAASLESQLDPRGASGGPGASARALAEELSGSLQRLERALATGVDRAGSELMQVRDAAQRIRLLPARVIFPSLERATRDAARTLGRRAEFRSAGGDIRLDTHVLSALREALLHAVRNAVAHGVEPERERVAAGKAPAGAVEVRVERRGARVLVSCRDDGRGVDVDALRNAAVRSGRLTEEAARAMSRDDAMQLGFEGGVTTTRAADEVSGRGVGLDVVRAVATRLKGTARLRSEPGGGAAIELLVPVSLVSLTALAVRVDGATVLLPLDAVRRTMPLGASDVARGREGDTVVFEEAAIPFVRLERLLARPSRMEGAARVRPAVVLECDGARAVVGVDRLLGVAEVIVRPLPAWSVVDAVVAGTSLDAEGSPQMVLDPARVVAMARAGQRAEAPSAARRAPLLVIDDSLTTRMLEKSILESAGYEVELATSGEEGWEKARQTRYGLILVDVEMPGMTGFEFVEKLRADASLREIPAILVTSRNEPADLLRGEAVGAQAYMVKSEFDQRRLLQTIQALLGASR